MRYPSKQVMRPTAAFSTSNSNQPAQNLTSHQTQPTFRQKTENKSTETLNCKKSQQTRYSQSYSGEQQSQQQNF